MWLSRWLALAFLLWAFDIGAASAQTRGVTKDSITIGAFGPLTGPSYLGGKLAMNGAEVVFDEANAAGGIHGRKITLLREDDRCDPAAAIAAVKKLISQSQVFSISGGSCSNAAVAARDEIEKAGLPWVVLTAVHDGITRPIAPNIFSPALTSSIESEAQVLYTQKLGVKRLAILAMHDSWGRSRYEPLMAILKSKGIVPVADEEMAPDANDATPQALRLRAANPDAIIMILFPKPAAAFVRDAAKFAFKPLLIGQSGIADPVAFEEQVGMPGATSNFITISQVRYTPDSPEVDKWRKAIETKFPNDRLSVYNLFGVGHAEVVVEALKRAGPDLTRQGFIDAMTSLRDFPTDTYGAGITCTKQENRCNKAVVWIQKPPGGPVKVVDITKVD
ncbi:MAG TPA: ABC transporter substrate-binding protein [Stellaceae bacterium]|nr:ABC transporter substrate-binding protein [Stellaceae bacterium]